MKKYIPVLFILLAFISCQTEEPVRDEPTQVESVRPHNYDKVKRDATTSKETAIREKTIKIAPEEFTLGDQYYNEAIEFEKTEDYENALINFQKSKSKFDKAVEITLNKKKEALEALNKARAAIDKSNAIIKEAQTTVEEDEATTDAVATEDAVEEEVDETTTPEDAVEVIEAEDNEESDNE